VLAPLVVALAVAAPLEAESERVGVAWHSQATVDAATRQRLAQEVARELGVEAEQVIPDAIPQAQRLVAHEVDPDDARDLADLSGRLEAATALFRGGELQLARQQARAVLEQLRRAPDLPGAAGLAWQTHVLFARMEWTAGDPAGAAEALRRAVALDPDAELSTRRVPPDLAELYEAERATTLSGRAEWIQPSLGIDLRGAQVELDGRIGMRPLPPGEHFVVVRWPGTPPASGVVGGNTPLQLTRPRTRVGGALPVRVASAERICEVLELRQLLLARVRDGRLGLQAYRCGSGYGEAWYSDEGADDAATWGGVGVAMAVDAPQRAFRRKRSPLLDRTPWPETTPRVASRDGGGKEGTRVDEPPKKPWYRRAWIWVLVGGVVVAGVTTGAVLGTREPDREIEANFVDWTGANRP
jgi:hypothetical protein